MTGVLVCASTTPGLSGAIITGFIPRDFDGTSEISWLPQRLHRLLRYCGGSSQQQRDAGDEECNGLCPAPGTAGEKHGGASAIRNQPHRDNAPRKLAATDQPEAGSIADEDRQNSN